MTATLSWERGDGYWEAGPYTIIHNYDHWEAYGPNSIRLGSRPLLTEAKGLCSEHARKEAP